jgi:release factor glutamine methyltransferase
MSLKELREKFHTVLESIYDKNEVDSFFFILLEHYLGYNRIKFALEPELTISEKDRQLFLDALKALKHQQPIQYILGETEFFGIPLKVNEDVLIPRPETEELVAWIINDVSNLDKITILDIGTGSGCIAIALAKHLPNASVFALDVGATALKVAKTNAELNTVSIEFLEADILNFNHFTSEKFDIIVSNPPYVRQLEKPHMKANVLDNEPHLALFVTNEDPLQFYKAITKFAVNNLNNKGMLYFEINEYLGNEMTQLLEKYNFSDVLLKQDIFNKDRMIKATKSI